MRVRRLGGARNGAQAAPRVPAAGRCGTIAAPRRRSPSSSSSSPPLPRRRRLLSFASPPPPLLLLSLPPAGSLLSVAAATRSSENPPGFPPPKRTLATHRPAPAPRRTAPLRRRVGGDGTRRDGLWAGAGTLRGRPPWLLPWGSHLGLARPRLTGVEGRRDRGWGGWGGAPSATGKVLPALPGARLGFGGAAAMAGRASPPLPPLRLRGARRAVAAA